jgi:hypothetical protein
MSARSNASSGKSGPAGAIFTADLSAIGGVGSSGVEKIFGSDKIDVIDEERRMIEKVFSIVDKDHSGSIDAHELEEMFKLFGVETSFLTAAIGRVMQNTDQDHDGHISPEEFYKLLSMKFTKGDSVAEMEDVFDRMGAVVAPTERPKGAKGHGLTMGTDVMFVGTGPKKGTTGQVDGIDGDSISVLFSSGEQATCPAKDLQQAPQKELGVKELHKVAVMLGEPNIKYSEIKDMIRCFKRLSDNILNKQQESWTKSKSAKPQKLRKGDPFTEEDTSDPANRLNLAEFIAIMNMDL